MCIVMKESISIQSDIANLPAVEECLFGFCHLNNVGNYHSAVSVAAIQAVKNAIIHGNRLDTNKMVEIVMGNCRGGIFVEVADSGEGFDYNKYGNLPADDSQVGEGIFVMRSLADRVTYYDGGRRVRLEFEIAGIDPADALERIAIVQHYFSLVAA